MRNAVVAGSLGTGNLGDDGILRAFLDRHGGHYGRVTVLADPSAAIDAPLVRPPTLATGRRFWHGTLDRRRVRQLITMRNADAPIDYVWVGGLLGHFAMHLRSRRKELAWAGTLCDRFVYYFGDASDGFAHQPAARRLAKRIDRLAPWVAVRSHEARSVLEGVGLEADIRIGVDPVLHRRADEWGTPFLRRRERQNALAIVPCNSRPDEFRPLWLAAARAGVDLGLTVRWVSVSDRDDLALCQVLRDELAADPGAAPQELHSGPDAESAIASADLCVATRYHGLIFGITCGVPTIPVPYDSKVNRLANRLGLAAWTANPDHRAPGDRRDGLRGLFEAALAGEWAINAPALAEDLASHRRALQEFERTLVAG